jgi:hypothetical protein
MFGKKKEKPLFDKEKIFRIVNSLITHQSSVLSVKYLHSHEKVVILYKDNVIELNGGEEKFIKYLDFKVTLSKKEYNEMYNRFMDEVKIRKEKLMIEKFEKLEHSLNPDSEQEHPLDDKIEPSTTE